MPENYVYFDLETQRSANDVGGWDRKADMKMSVGVTYSSANGSYMIYDEANVQGLIDELVSADVVVGFNHIWFDYEVLMGYTILDLKEQTTNVDLMLDLEQVLEHKPSSTQLLPRPWAKGKPQSAPTPSSGGRKAVSWKSPNTAASTSRSPSWCTNTGLSTGR